MVSGITKQRSPGEGTPKVSPAGVGHQAPYCAILRLNVILTVTLSGCPGALVVGIIGMIGAIYEQKHRSRGPSLLAPVVAVGN
jgi:hypothetical protein